MNTQVQERPLEMAMSSYDQAPSDWQAPSAHVLSTAGRANADVYASQYPRFLQGPGEIAGGLGQIGGGFGAMMKGLWDTSPPAMLWNMMQQLWSYMQQQQTQSPFGFGDNEPYYGSATGGSNGDPHLSFNGSSWNNMCSQADLLHSDSIPGGYQLSTQTTQPQANGITYNQSATVTTNNGQTQVSLDKNGTATITQDGNSYSIPPGTTYDLGSGETVQRNNDGSLAITCTNGYGGQITTKMTQNASGVDVNTQSNNVDLGGALVNGQNGAGRTLQPMEHVPSQWWGLG